MIYLDNAATTIKKPDAVYDAVLDAVGNGSISPQRLDEAAGRVLSVKLSE